MSDGFVGIPTVELDRPPTWVHGIVGRECSQSTRTNVCSRLIDDGYGDAIPSVQCGSLLHHRSSCQRLSSRLIQSPSLSTHLDPQNILYTRLHPDLKD